MKLSHYLAALNLVVHRFVLDTDPKGRDFASASGHFLRQQRGGMLQQRVGAAGQRASKRAEHHHHLSPTRPTSKLGE